MAAVSAVAASSSASINGFVGAADVGTGVLTTGGASEMSSKDLGTIATSPISSQADKDTAATELSIRLKQSQGSQGSQSSQDSDDSDDPLKKLVQGLEKMGLPSDQATQVASAMAQSGVAQGCNSGDIM